MSSHFFCGARNSRLDGSVSIIEWIACSKLCYRSPRTPSSSMSATAVPIRLTWLGSNGTISFETKFIRLLVLIYCDIEYNE
ncbi:hypothetical protein BLOT_004160 [Blomia tropicalis]|nr:hypothetical protein BLOT_004160 [Blomia tropicalis]